MLIRKENATHLELQFYSSFEFDFPKDLVFLKELGL